MLHSIVRSTDSKGTRQMPREFTAWSVNDNTGTMISPPTTRDVAEAAIKALGSVVRKRAQDDHVQYTLDVIIKQGRKKITARKLFFLVKQGA